MLDYTDMIKRGRNILYKMYCDTCFLEASYRPRSSVKEHLCRSCAAKKSMKTFGNPMQGKKHKDKHKFRMHSYENMDYNDTIVVHRKKYKCIKYRKICPMCKKDMGYHINLDGYRKCIQCQGDKNRKNTLLQNRLKSSMKASLSSRLKNRLLNKNRKSTFDILKYTVDDLKKHLESQFNDGMSWDNYGEWHIDHKIPDSWFNYDSIDHPDFVKSWALNNLQPLWAKDNLRKSNKWSDK